MTTVYRCQPGWPATQIVLLLEQHGIPVAVVGDGASAIMAPASVTVEIAVPEEPASAAAVLVQRFENTRAIAVARHARELHKQVAIAGFGGVAISSAFNFLAFPFHAFRITTVLGEAVIVGVVLLIILGRRSKGPPASEFGPKCPGCDYSLIGLPEPRCPECALEFDADFFNTMSPPTGDEGP